jgi:hypothetical protein
MAIAHHHGLAAEGCRPEGSAIAIMAPKRGSQKAPSLQGKSRRVQGSVPFGGSNGLVCNFFISREKYCHNGGTTLPANPGAQTLAAGSCGGSMIRTRRAARGPV